jgi:uncharacterized protein YndB with AHSA1/START domain
MTDRLIELTRTIDAPVSTVFRALTDAGELARWWPSSAESDARTGGSFSYRFEFDDSSRNHAYTGDYHEVVANERVSYPWQGALGETRVDVSLRPAGGATELTLVHSGWGAGEDWDAAVQMHEQGWGFFLDNLKAYLERGEDARGAAMGMRTPAVAGR